MQEFLKSEKFDLKNWAKVREIFSLAGSVSAANFS